MNVKRIMRIRKSLRDAHVDELQELANWCNERAQIILRREKERAEEAAWLQITNLPVGYTVFSHLNATKTHTSWAIVLQSVGRPYVISLNLFGKPLRIYAVDETRVWLSYSGWRAIAFTRNDILTYQIKTFPPAEAVTNAILSNTQS